MFIRSLVPRLPGALKHTCAIREDQNGQVSVDSEDGVLNSYRLLKIRLTLYKADNILITIDYTHYFVHAIRLINEMDTYTHA